MHLDAERDDAAVAAAAAGQQRGTSSVLQALAEQTQRTVAEQSRARPPPAGAAAAAAAAAAAGGGSGGGEQMNAIVDVVMQHLLSKEVLYQPMKVRQLLRLCQHLCLPCVVLGGSCMCAQQAVAAPACVLHWLDDTLVVQWAGACCSCMHASLASTRLNATLRVQSAEMLCMSTSMLFCRGSSPLWHEACIHRPNSRSTACTYSSTWSMAAVAGSGAELCATVAPPVGAYTGNYGEVPSMAGSADSSRQQQQVVS